MRLRYFLLSSVVLATTVHCPADDRSKTPTSIVRVEFTTVDGKNATKKVAIVLPAEDLDDIPQDDGLAATDERAFVSPWIKDAVKAFIEKPLHFLLALIKIRLEVHVI
ncbi:hypothetical protein GN244_ATG06291 [Phytophthora infestans]|uniref:Secreted RxLR effector peptide protein n=1 Tax=Phytophthora infestans TaxID=4787 RepID=A0A833WXL1_PHYIN|nr:hypothetical protein GN244_ATG06291 [Phytophthora infestans]